MISPFDLQCEYAVDPVGIDARKPRFSWLLQAEERSQSQSAYQILVASSEANLLAGVGDRWDSGRVASADMAHVEYEGAALPAMNAAGGGYGCGTGQGAPADLARRPGSAWGC